MNNIYIYDQFLSARKYQKLLEQLETRLTDLGIGGKIYRLAPLTRFEDAVREELAKKPKTVVAVGGDALASRLAGALVGQNIAFGFIPIGTSMIADAFGISLENACRTLAARRLINVDLGIIDNKHNFVCRAEIKTINPKIIIDGELTATTEGSATIEAINIVGDDFGYRGAAPRADDGKLNAYILKSQGGFVTKEISQSSFVCKQLEIVSGVTKVLLDGGVELSSVKSLEISRRALTAIVGKERTF